MLSKYNIKIVTKDTHIFYYSISNYKYYLFLHSFYKNLFCNIKKNVYFAI